MLPPSLLSFRILTRAMNFCLTDGARLSQIVFGAGSQESGTPAPNFPRHVNRRKRLVLETFFFAFQSRALFPALPRAAVGVFSVMPVSVMLVIQTGLSLHS